MPTCDTDKDCEREGRWSIKLSSVSDPVSRCNEGYCTNPYAELGCLSAIASDRDDDTYRDIIKTRVCNSDDAVGADIDNIDASRKCRRIQKEIAYDEVRIAISDWESTIVNAWVYQIILSEILDVPTTIETGYENSTVGNFYDFQNRFLLGRESYPFEYLKESMRLAEEGQTCDSSSNKHCAHLLTEIWDGHLNEARKGEGQLQLCHANNIEFPKLFFSVRPFFIN